ncbi:class-III pyridoxal-phosphate-dependent aminotransferase [Desulfoluna spongiiphila]|uniref:class-III pyridoxal-phosphate-dependent aminotransferase n=1 Tax=Desulfoluna spongiiphila TaxID=419481 RepID=UPI00125AFE07|nr:aspartate aminotransferase family protein [Desulfoluna spongiiphila]VVS92575.1 pyridoxal phosphate-dependent transferase [Desulfoluna spongiiphila]
MPMPTPTNDALPFNPGTLKRMKRLGHAFLESRPCGSWMEDQEGRRYLDAATAGGICNLGRRPEAIVEALKEAAFATDQGNFPLISSEKAELAEALAGFAPEGLSCVMFSVVRGESVDFSCKLARGATRRSELISLSGSWFGHTGFAMSLSDRRDKHLYGSLLPETRTIEWGDTILAQEAVTDKTAALILEPVQAENQGRTASRAYLSALRRITREKGALLIFDETQSGFGRCGARFACEEAGVLPDILITGEALGAGIFPICATLFTRKLHRFLNAHPLIHLSTFGGSDVGCRVALAALSEYERVAPWENARAMGDHLKKRLTLLKADFPDLLTGVDGMGLLLSLGFPSQRKAGAFCRMAAGHGLFVVPGAVACESVTLRPSLLLTEEEGDYLLDAVEKSLRELKEASSPEAP